MKPNLKFLTNSLFVILFLFLLSLPLFLWLSGIKLDGKSVNENRKYASLDLKSNKSDLFKNLENFLSDNMPLRSFFIHQYDYLWNLILKSSNAKYYIANNNGGGRKEFFDLYYNTLQNQLGYNPINKEYLNTLKLQLEKLNEYLASKGIILLVVLTPDKETNMSMLIPIYLKAYKSWREQIIDVFGDAKFKFLDINGRFLKENNGKRLYNRYFDIVHWNGNGLLLASKIISDTLYLIDARYDFRKIEDNFSIIYEDQNLEISGKESVPMLKNIGEEKYIIADKDLLNLGSDYPYQWHKATHVVNTAINDNSSFVIFSDSYFKASALVTYNEISINIFANYVQNYIHAHYMQLNSDNIKFLIETFKPKVVIVAFAERAMGFDLNFHDILVDSAPNKE